jgi:hypothetical protein
MKFGEDTTKCKAFDAMDVCSVRLKFAEGSAEYLLLEVSEKRTRIWRPHGAFYYYFYDDKN